MDLPISCAQHCVLGVVWTHHKLYSTISRLCDNLLPSIFDLGRNKKVYNLIETAGNILGSV